MMLSKSLQFLLIIAVLIGVVAYNVPSDSANSLSLPADKTNTNAILVDQKAAVKRVRVAKNDTSSSFWITFKATVTRILKDDLKGSKHQRFLVRMVDGNDLTLLIAHNIDLADRVPINRGDVITVRGKYEWNNKGGVVHWTHHDPKGKREGGWIKVGEEIIR